MSRRLSVPWLLVGLGLLASGAPAQQRPPAAVFADAVDVRIVNVEVVVTDRQGRRVQELGPDDFELLVDGEPTPIDFFTEVVDGAAKARAAGGAPGVPGFSPEEPVGIAFLIFVDDAFSIEADRNRVLDGLGDGLAPHFGPADRVAVVAFDGARMETLTPWTNSLHDLDDALDRARERPAYGMHRRAERLASEGDRKAQEEVDALGRVGLLGALDSGGVSLTETVRQRAGRLRAQRELHEMTVEEKSGLLGALLSPMERTYADALTTRLERSVLAAVAALRGHAGQPGRKAMLLLSGGWPASPAQFAVARGAERTHAVASAADGRLATEDAIYRPLIEAANLMGYTLYPVDVPGFDPGWRGAASEEGRRTVQGATTTVDLGQNVRGTGALPGPVERETLLHGTLESLARATGGLPMIDARRDAALAKGFEDVGFFYWLGFQPKRREDDRRRDIQVRLAGRPGLDARAREGYVDMSRDREFEMTVEAALLFGDVPTARSLGVRFGEPTKAKRGRMAVPVEVIIPLDEVLLVPVGDEWRSELELRVGLIDEAGNRSAVPGQTITIAGPHPPGPGQAYLYETGLVLQRKPHRYALTVFDPLTGAILTSTGTISP